MLPNVSNSSACTAGSASSVRACCTPRSTSVTTRRLSAGPTASSSPPWNRSSMNRWMRCAFAASASASFRARANRTRVEHDEAQRSMSDDDHRRDAHRAPIAPHELAGAVAQRVRARLERLAAEVMVDVADQRVDRRVPARRILVHGREAQHVEVGPLRLLADCAPRAADRQRRCRAAPRRTDARAPARRSRASTSLGVSLAEIERQPAGEQLVEHDAERVDVGMNPEAARRGPARARRTPAS